MRQLYKKKAADIDSILALRFSTFSQPADWLPALKRIQRFLSLSISTEKEERINTTLATYFAEAKAASFKNTDNRVNYYNNYHAGLVNYPAVGAGAKLLDKVASTQ